MSVLPAAAELSLPQLELRSAADSTATAPASPSSANVASPSVPLSCSIRATVTKCHRRGNPPITEMQVASSPVKMLQIGCLCLQNKVSWLCTPRCEHHVLTQQQAAGQKCGKPCQLLGFSICEVPPLKIWFPVNEIQDGSKSHVNFEGDTDIQTMAPIALALACAGLVGS